MTRRTRKFIIDNTTGTVYSNIDNPALATKVNVSAGLVPKIIKVSPVKAGKPIVKVVSNKAIIQKKNLVITNVFLQVTDAAGKENVIAAPIGSSVTVALRKVALNGTSTTLGSYSIASNSTSSTNSVNFNILDTDLVFADITSVGSVRSGLGLNIVVTYFG